MTTCFHVIYGIALLSEVILSSKATLYWHVLFLLKLPYPCSAI